MAFTEQMLNEVLLDVEAELDLAVKKFKPFNGAHEGYAIMLEEMDELWIEVKRKHPVRGLQYREARQVAAMAIRFMLDVCGGRIQ